MSSHNGCLWYQALFSIIALWNLYPQVTRVRIGRCPESKADPVSPLNLHFCMIISLGIPRGIIATAPIKMQMEQIYCNPSRSLHAVLKISKTPF